MRKRKHEIDFANGNHGGRIDFVEKEEFGVTMGNAKDVDEETNSRNAGVKTIVRRTKTTVNWIG